ncbi:DUF3108 domain-containing protein [Shimia thalassica]|uniref:DUF3108 domain-containing protein n=1 Tax=Shimia thalassica TaxID=1715693 RepID=UPI0026E1D4CE|nr:DUF3108 domain-containing protein [Shimia thalassica]MDO6483189.1 DUF3108 domain-containing protein [Shimia thalassica]MDP2495106.1 DUF3108 domain-containing protein [Shimia thalassica]
MAVPVSLALNAPPFWGDYMPCRTRACPASIPFLRRKSCRALLCAAVATVFAAPVSAEQLWSVHAFGLKVGELRVAMTESGGTFSGVGKFQTTGLVGVVASIHFDAASKGRIVGQSYVPATYDGHINTGKRVSETSLAFKNGIPHEISGKQDPAVPISDAMLKGAIDPMTLMWLTLRDQPDAPECSQDEKQFDGTRLARLHLTRKTTDGDKITCSGSYDRLGGYSAEELAEMSTSPASVTYQMQDGIWRSVGVKLRSRHGPATLVRRN